MTPGGPSFDSPPARRSPPPASSAADGDSGNGEPPQRLLSAKSAHAMLRAERLKKLRQAVLTAQHMTAVERAALAASSMTGPSGATREPLHPSRAGGGALEVEAGLGADERVPLTGPEAEQHVHVELGLMHDLRGLWHMVFGPYVHLLLICCPLGVASGMLEWPPLVTFALNFAGIVPLASLLGNCTEELAYWTGPTIGGLINASLGNAPEMIISLIAMQKGLLRVVQASLLGSVLSNSLLVLGCCFLAGGFKYHTQTFNKKALSVLSGILFLSCMGIVLPSGIAMSDPPMSVDRVLLLSRITSGVLILMYAAYLYFTIGTHADIHDGEGEEEEEEGSTLSATGAVVGLLSITVGIAVCSEFLTGAIEPVSGALGLSFEFIGLVLLPIVGNAAEHMTAVVVAYKNKMDLAMAVALGSSIQVALFVVPFLVLAGWAMGSPLSLNFQFRNSLVFFLSVSIVNLTIADGVANWLKGSMLLGAYSIIAIAYACIPEIGR